MFTYDQQHASAQDVSVYTKAKYPAGRSADTRETPNCGRPGAGEGPVANSFGTYNHSDNSIERGEPLRATMVLEIV